jgi:Bacteriophage lambda head decoration protein D
MPTLTQAPSQGDVVKFLIDPNYTNEAVILLAGTAYKSGSVLGKITATGKYKLATAAGADGAQIASAVLLNPVDATAADATGVILARGPAIVSKAALVFDVSVSTVPLTATKYAELIAVGIVPRTSA